MTHKGLISIDSFTLDEDEDFDQEESFVEIDDDNIQCKLVDYILSII
jgi:hypothetical protein